MSLNTGQRDPGFHDQNSEAEAEAQNREFDMFDHVDSAQLSNFEKPSTSLHTYFVTQTHSNTKINNKINTKHI